jgi:hypothetical protein
MSLWSCQSCRTLQGFSGNMRCSCGGRLEFATVTSVTSHEWQPIETAPKDGRQLSSQLPLSKGPTRRQVQSRKTRADAAAIKAVRLLALERDGRCWFATNRQGSEWIHCMGLPELAHLPPRTRARTRGMAPEYRHNLSYVAILCTAHHARVDGRSGPRLVIPTPLESL